MTMTLLKMNVWSQETKILHFQDKDWKGLEDFITITSFNYSDLSYFKIKALQVCIMYL